MRTRDHISSHGRQGTRPSPGRSVWLWTWQPRSEFRARVSRGWTPASSPVRVWWPAATPAAQRTLSRAAAVMQGELCCHLALGRPRSGRLKPHSGGTRGPASHPSSEGQHGGTLRRAVMERGAHSPTRAALSCHGNGSVVAVHGFQWWFWVQVGWLALPRKSPRIMIYKAWFDEMHASSVFQKTGARIQTLIENKMWPKLNVVLSLITAYILQQRVIPAVLGTKESAWIL